MSQRDIADVIGVDQATVSRWIDAFAANADFASPPDDRPEFSRGEETRSVAAKKAGWQREQINEIAETKVLTEVKGGRMLLGVERDDGGRPQKNVSQSAKGFLSVLGDAGISKDTAYRWQTITY